MLPLPKPKNSSIGLGIQTRLADHGIGEEELDTIIASLEKHGMTALSESGDVTPSISRQILMAAL